jgi:hypothetical protein
MVAGTVAHVVSVWMVVVIVVFAREVPRPIASAFILFSVSIKHREKSVR